MKPMLHAEHIEQLIDAYGVARLLETIADICGQKAEHIESNWQDALLSKQWEKAGFKINNTAMHVKSLLP